MEEKIFNLEELGALTALSKRTIRYYIQLGLAPRPVGEARGAYYTSEHLERLLRVKKLAGSGVSLERVREVLAGEAEPVPPRRQRPGSLELRSHLFVAPGLEIQITPQEAGLSPETIQEFVRGVLEVAERVLAGRDGPDRED